MTEATRDVDADIAYLEGGPGRAEHRIYPQSSGRPVVRPPHHRVPARIHDARRLSPAPSLHEHGFMLLGHTSEITDFYDDEAVRRRYYPEVAALLTEALGALEVIVFDHNQRSAERAAAGQSGIRTPVAAAHVDYTPSSGPRRAREILEQAGRIDHAGHRLALVNAWRPIRGPVQDMPLAVCDPRTTRRADYVETDIHHFGEDDLERPRHTGQIYSLRHAATHRWYYVPDMTPNEVLLLSNWVSDDVRHLGYAAHTGFDNPLAPPGAMPRESIEARTLVIYP